MRAVQSKYIARYDRRLYVRIADKQIFFYVTQSLIKVFNLLLHFSE